MLIANLTKHGHWIRDLYEMLVQKQKKKKPEDIGWEGLTSFRAEIAVKYGAPVYSRQPPTTAIFPV